jgi:tetratricopeptide (TPR) repeat protein
MLRTHLLHEPLGAAVSACGLAVAIVVLPSMSSVQAADTCAPVIATVVSIQGGVELRRSPAGRSEAGWQAAELNAALCAGDTIRTHERSRAALLLTNETTLRLDQRTTLTLAAPAEDKASLLDLATGALHVITRTSRPFRVRTPFVNANVEGTEFLVTVGAESASVAVYEGRVTADNERGSVALNSGERAIAARNSAPRKEVVVRPRDAVQWTLYFPTIFDYRLGAGIAGAPGESALQESIELYRKGKLADAIARLDSVPEGSRNPRFLIYRAGLLLLVGRLDEAKPDIERALALDPRNSDAYSLQAVIAVVENDKDLALSLADKAVDLDPASPTARIALSYAQQAQFKIEQALATVQKAVDLDPQNALAWARLAELEMAGANLDRALDSARRAAELNPALAKTQSVLGFANLARIETKAAKQAFEKAIELDSADPFPRLGLGLAKIRDGDLGAGRQEIEIATSLDPDNSLIRSYLGKAYYEEKRDKLAGTEYEQAKELDPSDPTPWLYDAIRKQTENRPVEALQDLEKSIELNDKRAVYRSRFLLDEDQATRSVNQARIYRDLGFEQLALVEAYKSLAVDPGNDSAHRFLADAYSNLPRHDIARVSESLQAQLRQPTSIPSVDLLLSTDNLFILRDTGPFRLGANEFSQLFDRNQVRLQVDAIGGNHQTFGDQVVVSGLTDKIGYAVSQLHYETNGFRDNNDAQKDIYDIFVQGQVSPAATVQIDIKRTRFRTGQTFFAFDPDFVFPTKIKEDSDAVRVGGHYTIDSQADFIWSTIYEDRDRSVETVPDGFFVTQDTARTFTGELQYLRRFERGHLIAGIGYLGSKDQFNDGADIKSESGNAYVYGYWRPTQYDLRIELGLAAEHVDVEFTAVTAKMTRNRLSPKLGLIWSPSDGTTVRAAAFSSVKRPFIASQTIEPTQVAGFNQFFTGFDRFYGDIDGTVSQRVCLAIDQKFSYTTFAGAEITARKLDVPSLAQDRDFTWKEKTARLYAYKAFGPFDRSSVMAGWQVATSIDYEYERIERPQILTGPEGILKLTTQRVPLALKLFNANGLSIGASTAYVRQQGSFSVDEGLPEFSKREAAWITDIYLDYRLPQRMGILSIGAKNVFDQAIDLVSTDPAFPIIPNRRFVYARARLLF